MRQHRSLFYLIVSTLIFSLVGGSYPRIFPIPRGSLSDGMTAFKILSRSTQFSQGKIVTINAEEKTFSTVAMKSYMSESVLRYPKASRYAASEITSRVRYCAFRAKSIGLVSASVDRYLVRMRLMKTWMLRSIVPSRSSFSFPEYFNDHQIFVETSVGEKPYPRGHHCSQLIMFLLISLG